MNSIECLFVWRDGTVAIGRIDAELASLPTYRVPRPSVMARIDWTGVEDLSTFPAYMTDDYTRSGRTFQGVPIFCHSRYEVRRVNAAHVVGNSVLRNGKIREYAEGMVRESIEHYLQDHIRQPLLVRIDERLTVRPFQIDGSADLRQTEIRAEAIVAVRVNDL